MDTVKVETKVEVLLRIRSGDLEAIVNERLKQIEAEGAGIAHITYLPFDYEIKGPINTRPDQYRIYDVIIEVWATTEN